MSTEPETEPNSETREDAPAESEPTPAPAARLKRLLPVWAIPIATAVAGGAIGAGAVGAVAISTPETVTVTETVTVDPAEEEHFELLQREGAVSQREIDAAIWEAELQAWEDELYGAEAAAAADTITDGVWTVGVDVEPGTYRATNVSSDCYWATLETGSNGSDIVDNDLPGGGNPTVTLEEGWDFQTDGCGDWVKQ
ncbi:hypothetical protein [Glycomyces dulcitolivorans]|uniref:hypothetical protein n=1 Tax=Glycomyces dulcitolivorans TaxID=2200759 RepID=UPI000DD2F0D3|nr:hypothetical protein [Glycomyces dulcitolivorans]